MKQPTADAFAHLVEQYLGLESLEVTEDLLDLCRGQHRRACVAAAPTEAARRGSPAPCSPKEGGLTANGTYKKRYNLVHAILNFL